MLILFPADDINVGNALQYLVFPGPMKHRFHDADIQIRPIRRLALFDLSSLLLQI